MASIKHLTEYAALRGLAGLVQVLPLRVALLVVWPLAALSHFVFRFRLAEARARLRQVFPDEPEERLRHIAWRAWRNLAFTGVEVLRMPRLRKEHVPRIYESLEPFATVSALLASGRGVLLAVCHAGNWDLCSNAGQLLGVPIFALARPQRNTLADAYLNRMRGQQGVPAMMNNSALLKNVVRRLRAGEAMAILPDVRSRTPGLPIRFLGATANLPAGTGLFARMADVPVVPVFLRRVGWTRHTIELGEPIRPNPTAERRAEELRITQELMSFHEQWIRRYPDQYFWFNKRWVLEPLSADETAAEPSG